MKKLILIADDNAVNRGVLVNTLRDEYDILEAGNGREALRVLQARAGEISAVLTDIVMPELDGYGLLREIKGTASLSNLPVVMVTGSEDEASRLKALSLGANDFILKPCNPEIVRHCVKNCVALFEATAALNAMRRDALTGLYTRESFFERVRELCDARESGYYVLTCCDVENFKYINEQYGTDVGDEVLRHIADTLKSFAEQLGGVVCRCTADRFGMLYPDALKDTASIYLSHEKAFKPDCLDHGIRIRIGRYRVVDLSLPVTAMYDRATLAEESIRNRYDTCIAEYSDAMSERIAAEQELINGMADALKNGEFEPWFQPQYNHATGALIGAEALVRWKKGGTYIPPSEFVPVFERNGFIYEMDKCVWESVCAMLRQWLRDGKEPLPVSVNISRRDLFFPDCVEVLKSLPEKYSLPIELLRLEVTESAFAEESGLLLARVNELISYGFTVEIDDFGSGYSSLNTLKDVPAAILKLDMRFFEKTEHQQRGGNIVESVVRMAKWLGMAVIAEGVEDREQADYLKSIGCYYIQGFFYAKPMPAQEYELLFTGSEAEPRLTRMRTLETLDNNEFWNPRSMETLIFNSYVGGACIFEAHDNVSELLRVNDQYINELRGLVPEGAQLKDSSIVPFLDAGESALLRSTLETALKNEHAASCEVHLTNGTQTEYIRFTARVIASTGERFLYYAVIVNVTEQREAERRQLESAHQLNVIMENIDGAVSMARMTGDKVEYFFTNRRFYEMLGYTREQFKAECPRGLADRLHPDDAAAVLAQYSDYSKSGGTAMREFRALRRDGSVIWLHANGSFCEFEGIDGYVNLAVYTDITGMRDAEQRERTTAARLRAIMANINGGITSTSIGREGDMTILYANDGFYELYGYTREQWGAELEKVFVPIIAEDRGAVLETLAQLGRDNAHCSMEYRCRKRDGSLMWTQAVITVLSDEPSGITLIAILTDTTERHRAEEARMAVADRLKAVMNSMPNGVSAIAFSGDDARLLFINDRFFEMHGIDKKSRYVLELSESMKLIYPEDREAVAEKTREALANGGSVLCEYRILRPDDKQTHWIRASISTTRLLGIDAPVQIGIYEDITSQKEAAEQISFLNDSAHDILAQPNPEPAVQQTLQNLMAYFGGDRAYVVELNRQKQVMNNTYEVCADNVESELALLQNVPYSAADYWITVLQSNGNIVVENVDALGEDQAQTRELLQIQNISSLIIAPLWRDGILIGYAGVDNPRRRAGQLDRLRALADYIAVLLTRRDLLQKIKRDADATRQLINDTPGGFVRIEMRDGKAPAIVGVNDGLCRMLGMTKDEITSAYGDDAYGLLFDEDITAASAETAQAFATLGQFSIRCRLRRKSGDALWTTVFGRFTKDEEGALFLNSYFTDITAAKTAEQQRIELLDHLPVGAAMYRYDGDRLTALHLNKRYWELVARKAPSESGFSVFDAIHPDDRHLVIQEISAAIRQKRDAGASIRIQNGDGLYIPFKVSATILSQEDGTYLLFAAYTPITGESMSVQELFPVALSTMMSSSEDLSFVTDKDLRYICCSKSDAAFLGLEDERDIAGKTDFDLFDRELAEALSADSRAVVETGEPITDKEERIVGHDGRSRFVSVSKYPIRDGGGNIVGMYGVSRDVTAQRETESRLELLTSSIPGGIATFRCYKDHIVPLYFNEGLSALVGYPKRVLEDRSADPVDFLLDEDKPIVFESLQELTRTKKPVDFVVRIHRAAGGFLWVNTRAAEISRDADSVLISAVMTDITEQQQERERLRQSEELNRLAIEQSGKIITRFDVASRTLTLPEHLNPIFNVPHVLQNMPGEQIERGRVSPETAHLYRALFNGIIAGRPTGECVFQQNSTIGWRWLEAKYTTVFAASGEPTSAVVSFTDITEQREKEAAYVKWQNSIESLPESSYTLFRCNITRGFSYDKRSGGLLSVEFSDRNQPFNYLTAEFVKQCVYSEDAAAYTAFANADTMLAEYYRGHRRDTMEFREQLPDGGLRWLRLSVDLVEYPDSRDIEAYLLFENIDDDKRTELRTIELAETDPLTGILNRATFAKRVNELLDKSADGALHALFMMDIDNFKSVNDSFGHGAGDQTLIDFAAKLQSACRHADLVGRLGGDEFVVFLPDISDRSDAENKAKQICEAVRKRLHPAVQISTSIGIAFYPDEGRDFDTLYTSADRTLYRVKEAGKGTYGTGSDIFKRESAVEPDGGRSIKLTDPAGRKPRMLIVDDSKVDQALLGNLFHSEYQIEYAASATAAMVKLNHYKSAVSVVLLDLKMTDGDGFSVLEKMQGSFELSTIPVIIVSSDDERETAIKAIRAGASDFIMKPVDVDLLRVRVQSAVSKAENERLRAQNSYLAIQSDEVTSYQLVMERSGTFMIALDWGKSVFTYSPNISSHLAGRYDARGLWRILLSDGVADPQTVQRLQQRVQNVANDRTVMQDRTTVELKSPSGEKRGYAVTIYKAVTNYGLTDRIILTFAPTP